METSRSLVVVMASCLVLAACGAPQQAEQQAVQEAVQEAGVFDQLAGRHGSASYGGWSVEIPASGSMPQVQYSVNGQEPIALSDVYVEGRVESVEPGRSYRWPSIDDEGETETTITLDFNAQGAMLSIVHVTLDIERSILATNEPAARRQELAPGGQITFGLKLNPPVDLAAVEAELQDAGLLAALLGDYFLEEDYFDPNVWGIAGEDQFLGIVHDGVVDFPIIAGTCEGCPSTFTLEELESPQSGGPIEVTCDEQQFECQVGAASEPAGPREQPTGTESAPATSAPAGD